MTPDSIDTIILSHDHGDHTGGLNDLLMKEVSANIFIPSSFNAEFEKNISVKNVSVSRVKKARQIMESIITTDELKGLTGPDEIGLILSSAKGPVLICGCAHPGVVAMARNAAEITGERIYAIFGGAHFYNSQENEIKTAWMI